MNARKKCSGAIKYKAVRAPRCGCEVCEVKWLAAESKRKKQGVAIKNGH